MSDLDSGEKIIYGAITGLDYADPRIVMTYTSNMFPEGTEVPFKTYYTRDPETHKINTLYFAQVVTGFKILFRTIDLYYSKVKQYHENVIMAQPLETEIVPDGFEEVLRSLGVKLKRIDDEDNLIYIGTLSAQNFKELKVESSNTDVDVSIIDSKSDVDNYFSKQFTLIPFEASTNHTLSLMKNTYIEEREGIRAPVAANDELIDVLMLKRAGE